MKKKSKKSKHTPTLKMPKDIREYWESLDPPRPLSWERDFWPSMMWSRFSKEEKAEARKIKGR